MIIARCIDKIRKCNKIVAYKLEDTQGKTMMITSSDLKDAIKSER